MYNCKIPVHASAYFRQLYRSILFRIFLIKVLIDFSPFQITKTYNTFFLNASDIRYLSLYFLSIMPSSTFYSHTLHLHPHHNHHSILTITVIIVKVGPIQEPVSGHYIRGRGTKYCPNRCT